MDIGSATLSPQVTAARQSMAQTASRQNTPAGREPDADRDDAALKVQPAPAKPVPAAVGKGLGLLVDISL